MRSLAAALLVAGCGVAEPPPGCAVPGPGFQSWRAFPDNIGGARWIEPPLVNTIRLAADGALSWNAAPIDEATLGEYLATTAAMEPQPLTTLDFPRGVSCARVERVRRMMRDRLDCARAGRCFQGASPAAVG